MANFLRSLFRRSAADDEDDPAPIVLQHGPRAEQLARLERALDALVGQMRAVHTLDDPGWRGRINEYDRLAGAAMQLRKSPTITYEAVLDVVFEVRPLFPGAVPPGLEPCAPLAAEVVAAAEDLRELLPGERG